MHRYIGYALLVLLALTYSESRVWGADPVMGTAADPVVSPKMVTAASASDDPAYAAGPIQKAQRGFVNAVFGWTEFFKRITEKTQEAKNPFADMLIGAWEGTCKAFARTASGASELVTFPIGRYDKPGILPDMPVREK